MKNMELISILVAIISLGFSGIALFQSGKANRTNKNMFKRQGVIDLHMAWQNVNDINPDDLVGPDIVKAVNALSLTATLWNHDVIEKSILYQTYWSPYRDLYDKLINLDKLVPGHKKTCRSLITNEIQTAYEGMKNADLKTVIQTTI